MKEMTWMDGWEWMGREEEMYVENGYWMKKERVGKKNSHLS